MSCSGGNVTLVGFFLFKMLTMLLLPSVYYRFPGFNFSTHLLLIDHTSGFSMLKRLFPVFFYLSVFVKLFLMLTTPLHGDRRRPCSVGEPGSLFVDSSASAYSLCRLPHGEHLA